MAKKANIQFTVQVPELFDSVQRAFVGEAVIEHILERTSDFKDKRGRSFKEYTDAYATAKGVSEKQVDLNDTGEMLSELEVVKDGVGFIDIGYLTSNIEADKVEGNVLGTYGGKTKPPKPRDFLGIQKKVLDDIIKDAELLSEEDAAIQAFLSGEDAVDAIIGGFEIG